MIEFDTAVQPAPRGTSPQAEPRQASQSWLREWEQARWQEQPRYEAQPQHDEASQPAMAESVAAIESIFGAPQPSVEANAAHTSRDDLAHAHEYELGVPTANTLPASSPSQPRPAFVMTQPTLSLSAATNTKAASAVVPAAETTAADRVAQPEWSSHSVHVHVGEQATSVWIRDANLTAQQALALLARLRPSLNTAGGAPSPLHLTLNGQSVDEPVKHTPTR